MKKLKNTEMPTLPSMPQLESSETMDDEQTTNVNDNAPIVTNGSLVSKLKLAPTTTTNGSHTQTLATITSTVTTATISTPPLTNGIKEESKQRQSSADESIESDSSSDDDYTAKPNSISIPKTLPKSMIPKPKNSSTAVVLVNGGNKYTQNKLVPYDDSEYDSGTESPPEVNTKAGPFQVTSTTTTSAIPNVVGSNFMKSSNSNDKVATNASLSNQHQHHQLSNGAKLLSGRRESDGNMFIKTTIITQNGNGKRPNEWHGNETTNKLMKLNHRGYGAAVQTWNGQKSNIEKEVSL